MLVFGAVTLTSKNRLHVLRISSGAVTRDMLSAVTPAAMTECARANSRCMMAVVYTDAVNVVLKRGKHGVRTTITSVARGVHSNAFSHTGHQCWT
jgi:hypothetical protein